MNRNVLIIKSVCLKVLSWSSLKKHLKTVLSVTTRSVSPKLASSLTDMNTDTLAEHVLSLYLFCKSGASGSVTLCLYTKRIWLKGSTSLLTLQNPRRNIFQLFKDSSLKQQRLSSRAQNAYPPSLSTFVDVMRSEDAIGSTDAMRSVHAKRSAEANCSKDARIYAYAKRRTDAKVLVEAKRTVDAGSPLDSARPVDSARAVNAVKPMDVAMCSVDHLSFI